MTRRKRPRPKRTAAAVAAGLAAVAEPVQDSRETRPPLATYSPLLALYKSRLREFYRQPARLFWVYGFPTLLAFGLGLAFRNPSVATVQADLVDSPMADVAI